MTHRITIDKVGRNLEESGKIRVEFSTKTRNLENKEKRLIENGREKNKEE